MNPKLEALIRQEIKNNSGIISFAHFMELALYTPHLGYYCNDTPIFGQKGDFVTAPELTPLFAHCFANQFAQLLDNLHHSAILEIGAGSGVFVKDVLLYLEKIHHLPDHYYILEKSSSLMKRQKQTIESFCPHLLSRIHWIEALPTRFNGIIFANEVMDALPVHCFKIVNNKIKERCVTWKDDRFDWVIKTPLTSQLIQQVESLNETYNFDDGYESEINIHLPNWISALATTLEKGALLLVDYGYSRQEYYRPDRNQGTLMCFYQHRAHDNPFLFVGSQDITAHVDFTKVVESAVDANLSLAGYNTQSSFLLGCGLMDLASETSLSNLELVKQNQAIKKLLLPSEMGELVKVMGFTKNMDLPFLGFSLHSRIGDL